MGCCGAVSSLTSRGIIDPNSRNVEIYLAKDVDLNRYAYCTTTERWRARRNLGYTSAGRLTVRFDRNDLGEWVMTSEIPTDIDVSGLVCLNL